MTGIFVLALFIYLAIIYVPKIPEELNGVKLTEWEDDS
jgi:hypothetical protein